LRSMLKKQLPVPEVFDVLIAELCKTGCVQAGATIRQAPHRPALPPQLQGAGGKLRSVLAAKPLEPPSRKELAPDAGAQQALRFLLETGEAVEVGEEVVLLAENFNHAVAMVKKFLSEKGSATVSDLRQALGTSRRIMVPLLERLDREGVTQRQGDRRVLKR
jgi:selenocysteine-specific elongation factor